jgi:hypothetical protein
VRVRHLDDAGRWSHWSAPVEIEIVAAGSTPFIRGDANGDGNINITDAIATLAHLFLGGASPACRKTEDTNDDGRLDLTDAVYLLRHLFLGGSPPLAPYPACGADPTSDELSCPAYACP